MRSDPQERDPHSIGHRSLSHTKIKISLLLRRERSSTPNPRHTPVQACKICKCSDHPTVNNLSKRRSRLVGKSFRNFSRRSGTEPNLLNRLHSARCRSTTVLVVIDRINSTSIDDGVLKSCARTGGLNREKIKRDARLHVEVVFDWFARGGVGHLES
jgi:hypothetical protein